MSLIEALRSYQQADEEGIMCIVSRQAVEEAADEIERLRAALKNCMGHLDTPIMRRRAGLDPDAVWLCEARDLAKQWSG